MKRWRSVINFAGVGILGLMMAACAPKGGAGSGRGGDGSGSDEYNPGVGYGTLNRIYYEFDQSVISSKAAETLKNNAKTIKSNPKMKVLVEGHCDERGTNEYNIALGERRAKAALDYLVSLGIERNRLDMKSWGEERPLDMDQAEGAYRKNRRGEFVVMSK